MPSPTPKHPHPNLNITLVLSPVWGHPNLSSMPYPRTNPPAQIFPYPKHISSRTPFPSPTPIPSQLHFIPNTLQLKPILLLNVPLIPSSNQPQLISDCHRPHSQVQTHPIPYCLYVCVCVVGICKMHHRPLRSCIYIHPLE